MALTAEAFYARVEPMMDDRGCWEWTGSISRYARVCVTNGKWLGAHIFSFILHKGHVPAGMYVCHTCDNKTCVNPNHLYAGTPQDNSRDAVNRERVCKKVRRSEVKELRASGLSLKAVARKLGIAKSTVWQIENDYGQYAKNGGSV